MTARHARIAGWIALLLVTVGVRLWNGLGGPRMWGYDAWGHVAYVFFLDLYRAVPWADQGWSYFHPPLHYVIGWALAQARSGEVLMRGLALWGSLASLLVAGLAARLARIGFPTRPGLALLAFGAVACLPVHYFMGPMPGNEMTATLLGAAALASFVRSECAARPSARADALTGLWLGLGLLTKFSGLLTLVALLAALGVRAALEPRGGEDAAARRRHRGARARDRRALLRAQSRRVRHALRALARLPAGRRGRARSAARIAWLARLHEAFDPRSSAIRTRSRRTCTARCGGACT